MNLPDDLAAKLKKFALDHKWIFDPDQQNPRGSDFACGFCRMRPKETDEIKITHSKDCLGIELLDLFGDPEGSISEIIES